MTQQLLANLAAQDFPIHEEETREALAARLARDVADRLATGLAERGEGSLVLSGGSTPIQFLAALRRQELAWRKLWVTVTDERWVSASDPASNELLVRTHLLTGEATASRFVSLTTGDSSPEAGVAEVADRLAEIPRPFDVVIAGMGDDAHTASLFPAMPNLSSALDQENTELVVPATAPAPPLRRISLTLAALIDCRHLFLLIHGNEKLRVLESALTNADNSTAQAPVAALLRSVRERTTVYWAP